MTVCTDAYTFGRFGLELQWHTSTGTLKDLLQADIHPVAAPLTRHLQAGIRRPAMVTRHLLPQGEGTQG
jgi:hypothetical protein